jgi:hypothetical protein
MCNLYNHHVTAGKLAPHFQAADDWRRWVEVEKEYTLRVSQDM